MILQLLSWLPSRTSLAYTILGISAVVYAGFWIWGIVHAAGTPKATLKQRLFWAGSMFVNPSTTVWYWYIWKRWAFWILFTPILGAFISLPFVLRSLLSNSAATRLTNGLFALGTQQLIIVIAVLMIFPLILRLAALLHLGKNADLSAMDRNDWVVSLAVPILGYGAGLAYCAKYLRVWAIISLGWWVAIALSFRYVSANIAQALVSAGEERREGLIHIP